MSGNLLKALLIIQINEGQIKILHSFLNRSTNIIMDHCYNEKSSSSWLVYFVYKFDMLDVTTIVKKKL